ncbi:EamA family transporter RarD [Peribacillus sp. SI8-4]|uniref:EamA family transporter RarD n=1 Tax=Peribacillus sp. SI8-4 TaxID=3048009 RepID=UPI00255512F3|nr:EamA family transporter RarD [Peribacillus sp. SI8-4]
MTDVISRNEKEHASSHQKQVRGYIYTALAYLLWGFLGLYWKALNNVSSMEILAHRILWGFIFIFTIMMFQPNKRSAFFTMLKDFKRNCKQFFLFLVASLAISGNWLIFIWAVIFGHIMEASLGLYISPIVSMMLSVLIVKEKVRTGTLPSMLMALLGVLVITYDYGKMPWIALSLAVTSGLYGLMKKYIKADALVGMCIETMMVTPFALIILVFLQKNNEMHFGSDIHLTALLLFAGILTALPLLWFTEGVKRIPLVTIGFFQYITPTITFLLGIFIFKNTIPLMHWISFSFIWLSVAGFSYSAWRGKK